MPPGPQGVPFDNRPTDFIWGYRKGVRFVESFNRLAVVPAGFPTLYAAQGVGTEVLSLTSARNMSMTTGASIGDNNNVFVSGMALTRGNGTTDFYFADPISQWEIDVIFALNEATLTEGFIGILSNNIVGLTVLPTTARHMGLFWDISVNANFRLTSANGTTQVNTDSTQAVTTGTFRLNIKWNANTGGTITLFSSTANFTTQIATVNVTAYEVSVNAVSSILNFLVQTETTAARTLFIREWSALAT